jgi:hypothetical protein
VDVLGLTGWIPNYQPPGGGSTDPATQAANDAIRDFFKGSGNLNRVYGPGHAWTAAMKNHEHMTTVRDEIRSKIQSYCGGQKSGVVGVAVPRSWTLNDQSLLTNARIFLTDVLAGAGLTSSVHSTGSFRFQYTITSIDCGPCTAKVVMDARDALRLGSATRIPLTNTSIYNDNSTPNTRGNTINLHWYWNEEVSRK